MQRPLRAKTDVVTLIVFSVVVDFIMKTSGHFECASIMTKILFMNGPKNLYARVLMAKSAFPMDAIMLLQVHFVAFDNHCIVLPDF